MENVFQRESKVFKQVFFKTTCNNRCQIICGIFLDIQIRNQKLKDQFYMMSFQKLYKMYETVWDENTIDISKKWREATLF